MNINSVTKFHKDFLIQIIGFPQSYRGKNLELQLINQGLLFKNVSGFEVSHLDYSNETYHSEHIARGLLKRGITRGEIGCALAHEMAYRALIDSGKKFGIIFEDDAYLIEHLDLNAIKDQIAGDSPRLIQLGYNKDTVVLKSSNRNLRDIFSEIAIPATGAFGYALNVPAAEKLITTKKDRRIVADWPVNSFYDVEFFIQYPQICFVNLEDSTSEIERISARPKLKKHNSVSALIRLFRSLYFLVVQTLKKNDVISTKEILYAVLLRDLLYRNSRFPVQESGELNRDSNRIMDLARKFIKMADKSS